MRLVCFTQFLLPSVGGMQVSNTTLLNGFVEAGHDVTVYYYGSVDNIQSYHSGFRVIDEGVRLGNVVSHFLVMLSVVEVLKSTSADCYIFLDENITKSLGFFPTISRLSGRGIISINSGSNLTRDLVSLRSKVGCFLVKRVYLVLDVIFVSSGTKDDLLRKLGRVPDGFPAIEAVGRPISREFFESKESDSYARSIVRNDLPIFFSCGRAENVKGGNIILEAINILHEERNRSDFNYIFAGDGSDLDGWKKYVAQHKLENVHFVGNVNHEILIQLFDSCKFSIFPSQYKQESFGRAWVESFARKRPVISTNIANLKYLVKDGYNSILIRPEVCDVANAISRGLEMSEDEYSQLQLNAFASSAEYSVEIIVKKILSALKSR